MRRLLLLVSSITLVDTMLYAALAPLLPHYADEFDLSKGQAGLLVGAYAGGVVLAAIPSGFAAARFGPKRAVLAGLALMALASLAFGFADSTLALGVSRLLQGMGSALSWAGGLAWLVAATPASRRGEMLGTAIGAATRPLGRLRTALLAHEDRFRGFHRYVRCTLAPRRQRIS